MAANRIADITGVILVGGKSRRMGRDKAFLTWQGAPLFEKVLGIFRDTFGSVLLAGGDAERFGGYGLPIIPDLYPGSALGGLYSGLHHAADRHIFVASCDMPFPSEPLLRYLCTLKDGYDCVVPATAEGFEPLFALYAKSALPVMREFLESGNFRIYDIYPRLRTRLVEMDELRPYLDGGRALLNINTPEELARIKPEPEREPER